MKPASRQAPRQSFCRCTRWLEEQDAKDGLQCSCRIHVLARKGSRGLFPTSSIGPCVPLLVSSSSSCSETDGEPMKIILRTPASFHSGSSLLALTLTHVHTFPLLTAGINPLANKHPANTQSLQKQSLTFSPY